MTGALFAILFVILVLGSVLYLPLGIISWIWVTLQSPQQLMGSSLSTNLLIAIACAVACLTQFGKSRWPFNGLIVLLLIYLTHTTITTFMSVLPDQAYTIWDRFWKTVALVMFIALFMRTRTRLHAIVLAMVLSLGLLAVKASFFTVVTGGGHRVLGPPRSQISDNNHFGAVLSMTLPFAIYLVTVTRDAFMRLCFLGAAAAFPMAGVFTYSRGALVALIAVSGSYWTLSRYKIRIAVGVLLLIGVAIPFMPDAWINRMSSIQESGNRETADASVQGRFDSWEAHWEMAKRRPLIGGGFRTIEVMQVWQTLHPAPYARAAHNSYFQTVGEHGFPGLILYLMLVFGTMLIAYRIRRSTRFLPELAWARALATACLFSTISYAVSSLALSLATFDFFYIVLAIVACLRQITLETIRGAR